MGSELEIVSGSLLGFLVMSRLKLKLTTRLWALFFCLFSAREHARAELRSAELSTSLQISFFLFLCELSSP